MDNNIGLDNLTHYFYKTLMPKEYTRVDVKDFLVKLSSKNNNGEVESYQDDYVWTEITCSEYLYLFFRPYEAETLEYIPGNNQSKFEFTSVLTDGVLIDHNFIKGKRWVIREKIKIGENTNE